MTPVKSSLSSEDSSRRRFRIFAVVVVYKMQPSLSSSVRTLISSAASCTHDLDLKILVWDNTPDGQQVTELPKGVWYRPAVHNPGLAVAYNEVIKIAGAEGYEWLLTLDQDSILPVEFLDKLSGLALELSSSSVVAAIVPQVHAGDRILSPFSFLFAAFPRWFRSGYIGLVDKAVYAANSGSCLRISTLQEIGGYDPMFPLDLSDTSLFHRIYLAGKRVFVAGDLPMQHDFALLDKQGRMSIDRYNASLLDDCAFWDIYMGPLARLERILRFAVRACKEALKQEEPAFRKRTLIEIGRRLFKSRKSRMEEWTAFATLRRDKNART